MLAWFRRDASAARGALTRSPRCARVAAKRGVVLSCILAWVKVTITPARHRPPPGRPMPYQVPRVQIVPLPDDQVSVQVDGHERLRWHTSPRDPRPFFFPLLGPSGRPLTRMGHPADPTHDHHRSF